MTKQRVKPSRWSQAARVLGTVALIAALSGCVYDGRPGGGWCWWHPARCR